MHGVRENVCKGCERSHLRVEKSMTEVREKEWKRSAIGERKTIGKDLSDG